MALTGIKAPPTKKKSGGEDLKALQFENETLKAKFNDAMDQVEKLDTKLIDFRKYFDMSKDELFEIAASYDSELKANARIDNMVQVLFENELMK